ncbi:MAG: tripartite tricarboxylate transporter TctB family protein [Clostridiales bacterium]|nr:tripartite tricarboxylate transporter TctB family protein [Clostridiales bacterium]
MMSKWKDLTVGICGMVFAAVLYGLSVAVGQKENQVMGADFFPKIAAVVLFVMFLILAVRGYQEMSAGHEEKAPGYPANYVGVVLTFIGMILYAMFLSKVGFIITSMIFLYFAIFMMTKKEEWKPVKSLIITVITVLAIYFIFTGIFGIRLPKGLL